jgi:hypothetical protein
MLLFTAVILSRVAAAQKRSRQAVEGPLVRYQGAYALKGVLTMQTQLRIPCRVDAS